MRMSRKTQALIIFSGILLFVSPLFGRRLGLIIGTNYTGNQAQIPPLDLCERDAGRMADHLKKHGHFDNVEVLLGKMVTADKLEAALGRLAKAAKKDDTVLIYFSGHGAYQRDAEAPNGLRNYIIMYDRPHISDQKINQWLSQIQSPRTVWIFDSCFSGGIARKGRKTRGSGDIPLAEGQAGKVFENSQNDFYFQNKTIIGSSDSNETSIEVGKPINHGIFTYYFTQGLNPENGDLNQDSVVTILEAFEWASRRVTAHAEKFQHRQHPQITGDASGIFIAGGATPRPITPQPIPAKPEPTKPEPAKPEPVKTEPEKPQPAPTPVLTDPVSPAEPEAPPQNPKGKIEILTTIFESLRAGHATLDPRQILRLNRRGNDVRRVRVLVSGEEPAAEIQWLDAAALRQETGEEVPLGNYRYEGQKHKNRVAKIILEGVPTGVHEIEIQADDYPILRRRLGVEEKSPNRLFVVASLSGYGMIQGRVFLKNFERPLAGQSIWLPTVKAPNQIHRMKSAKDGSFWFINLPPADDYYIKASFLENLPLDNRKLSVRSGEVTRIDVVLNQSLRF